MSEKYNESKNFMNLRKEDIINSRNVAAFLEAFLEQGLNDNDPYFLIKEIPKTYTSSNLSKSLHSKGLLVSKSHGRFELNVSKCQQFLKVFRELTQESEDKKLQRFNDYRQKAELYRLRRKLTDLKDQVGDDDKTDEPRIRHHNHNVRKGNLPR